MDPDLTFPKVPDLDPTLEQGTYEKMQCGGNGTFSLAAPNP
jgi:hypothetical protein